MAACPLGDPLADTAYRPPVIKAAQATGVQCIGLANRPHKVGALRNAGADAVIGSMLDLL
jgi:phosphoglycolate phosphatase-like HAD superfamily hydrolase